jgi:hypothetical protein
LIFISIHEFSFIDYLSIWTTFIFLVLRRSLHGCH